nr:alanine racemase [Shimia isoporae]
MMRNINRLRTRSEALGVDLRPHLKTCKSVEVARRVLHEGGAATVSTLKEVEEFAAAGVDDVVYAVGIAPDKLEAVAELRRSGCDVKVLLDSLEQAEAVVAAGVPALIEIDSDRHRGGVRADDPMLIDIGQTLDKNGLLRGVLTHAGESYSVSGREQHAAFAEMERSEAVAAANALRAAGLSCEVVSVGSTPTAHAATDLTGVTELRAGVYVFFDLVMAGIGVCSVDDIALSVLTTVIGHQKERGWILCDAGWMAMSRDRGTANQTVDQGYGIVCDASGNPFNDLIVAAANQEHGTIAVRAGSGASLPDLPVGTKIRILPNHACATAAQHESYNVISEGEDKVQNWPRFRGW